MNRTYELMFIVRPDMVDEDLNKLVSMLESSVTSGHGTVKSEIWGKRRLAYDLRKQREGTYAVIECSAEPTTIKEFERQLRLNEQVLRFMTTRVPVKKRVRGTPKREPAAVEEST